MIFIAVNKAVFTLCSDSPKVLFSIGVLAG